MDSIEGMYIAYVAGKAGEAVMFLIFRAEEVVGCDLGGFKIDGKCKRDDENYCFILNLNVVGAPNSQSVQGQNTGASGLAYNLDFNLPFDFQQQPFVSVATPLGPLNIRLEKARDLGALAL